MAKSGKNARIQIAETVIERLSRILTDKYGIKVVFEGTRVETSKGIIYLPVIPSAATEQFLKVMHGYLDHEAAHCVDSDEEKWAPVSAAKAKEFTMFNAMEDPRVNRRWCKRYPGASRNFGEMYEWSCEKMSAGDKGKRPWDSLSDFGKLVRVASLYISLGENDTHWFLTDVVEPDIMTVAKTKLLDLFRQAADASNTENVLRLAEQAMQRINEPELSKPQQIDPQNVHADAVPTSGDAVPSAQDRASMKEDPNAPKQTIITPQQSGGNEDGDDSGDEPGDAKPGAGVSENKPPATSRNFNATGAELEKDKELTALNNQLRDEARRERTDTDSYLIYTTAGDRFEQIPRGSLAAFGKFKAETSRMVYPLRQRLVRLMTSRQQSRWEGGKERGKIDKSRLFQLVTGTSKKVFRQQVKGDVLDLAVLMAIDHSGSMRGPKIKLASETSAVFGITLEQMRVPFAIYGWSTDGGDVGEERRRQVSREEQNIYKRWGNLWIGAYKAFEDNWHVAGPKVLTMPDRTRHNTYDGESVKVFANMLLRRPEKRKLLIILNDGEPCPNPGDDTQAHVNYAHAAAKEVEKMVETVTFGIMTSAVADIYRDTVVIMNLDDLPKSGVSKLEQILLKRKGA